MTLKEFFNTQVAKWPLAKQNYAALENVETRELTDEDGCKIYLQFNPARMVSTGAKIDKASIMKRPCFLCEKNRPKEQESADELLPEQWRNDFELLVNPFPILPLHFTIPLRRHEEQRILPHFPFMLDFVEMHDDMCVFYNGPRSGASAPDHMHFQAVERDRLPLFRREKVRAVSQAFASESKEECIRFFRALHASLPVPVGEVEPMMNVYVVKDDDVFHVVVILRNQHRPSCYGEEGRLISPGGIDMTGLIITPRKQDFEELTAEEIVEIQEEVSDPAYQYWFDYLERLRETEDFTLISVGLKTINRDAPEYAEEGYADLSAEGFHKMPLMDGAIYIPVCKESRFTIPKMPIGIQFHWQQKRDLVFSGCLYIADKPNGDELYINMLPLEDYLKSVISSEMSAMSNIELLKAHAIISRSWVMAQILGDNPPHKDFDVCADDHCQRYQGVTMQTTPLAEEAINATRGKYLKYKDPADGPDAEPCICDTRYSKCCGGRSEEFEYCWEDKHYDYLETVECPYCNTKAQFPNEEDERRVLSQVLNDYDLETKDFYEWEVLLTPEKLRELGVLGEHGELQEIIPLKRGKSGRIYQLKLVFANGEEKIIGKELAIRKALSNTHLYSSNFTVEKIPAKNPTAEPPGTEAARSVHSGSVAGSPSFLLKGKGWGHGVGLCQIGAAVMAEKGFKHDEILKYYFPKAIIDNR